MHRKHGPRELQMRVNNAPLVSLIIPVYNSEKYIHRCLNSVLSQSYTNFEVICIDDGSSDNSGSILDAYQAQNPGKFVVKHQANAGIAVTRNKGIEVAKGDYIAFIDNDDWIDANWLETLTDLIDTDEPADVICSGYCRPDKDGNIVTECHLEENGEWSPYLVGAPWAKLYRTTFIRESHLEFFSTNIGEDLPFVIPAIHKAKNCMVTGYSGYNWFYNIKSVSNTIHKKSDGLEFEKTLNKLHLELCDGDVSKAEPLIVRYFIRLIGWYLFYTRKGDGLRQSLNNVSYYESWLDRNLPEWRSCPMALPFSPSGDSLSNCIAVWLLAKHPHIFRTALTLYAKAR